jgi:pyrroloquinoline-quinone synthase
LIGFDELNETAAPPDGAAVFFFCSAAKRIRLANGLGGLIMQLSFSDQRSFWRRAVLTNNISLPQRIDDAIAQYAMLKHPFYQLWSEGKLDRTVLQEYAKQYYAHVRAFPTYVSAVHSQCNDLELRQLLLENLIEEERGPENHPELWLRFAEGMGVSRDEVRDAALLPSTSASVATFKNLTANNDFRLGVAALYAYESQIPEVATTKRAGLKEFYSVEDARSTSFFTVHETADVIHRQSEIKVLCDTCDTDETQDAVVAAAGRASQALWDFLSGVQSAYASSAAAAN